MKLVLHGFGRMGKAVQTVAGARGHEILAVATSKQPLDVKTLKGADSIVDFSNASMIEGVVEMACKAGVGLVIGTTGWTDKLELIRARCVQGGIGVVHAANFSPGANVTFALAREAARLFAQFPGYDVGIEERHHSQKQDAPSGTALRLATKVREGGKGAAPPIVSSRVGSEFGLHTLFFDSPDDLVEISHRARGREGFARGAVIAAERLAGKKGFFTFEELIGL